MTTIDVKGIPEVVAALNRTGDRATAAAQTTVDRYAGLVAREAKGYAPVDSGDLRASIRAELSRLAAVILSDLRYSATVELGRRDMPAYPVQPFLAPALETHRAGFARDIRAAVRAALAAQ